MGYLYKLVDKKGLKDAKNGIISLSRPILEFKGSEGKFINFAKRIYEKYQNKGLKIKPSETDLEDIQEWIKIYKKTYGDSFRDVDIHSESMIIFCGIMQGFCGYFTSEDLSDEVTKKEYLSKSHLKDKIAIIKIDETVFDHLQWSSLKVEGEYVKFHGDTDGEKFVGFMHPTTITYSEKYDDYDELLSIYNGDEVRKSHTWFNNLSKDFEWQKEKRLLFILRSLNPNELRIGCDSVYKCGHTRISWEEVVYGNIVDAIHYCSNGPRFITLKLGKEKIEFFDIND
ncbi:MAG: hypothetical protein AB7E09_05215 [Candidatus Izemoplasmatales bacterium]